MTPENRATPKEEQVVQGENRWEGPVKVEASTKRAGVPGTRWNWISFPSTRICANQGPVAHSCVQNPRTAGEGQFYKRQPACFLI